MGKNPLTVCLVVYVSIVQLKNVKIQCIFKSYITSSNVVSLK